jgi:hypothetical protein
VLCVLLQMSNQLIRRLWLKHLQGPRRVRNYIAVFVFFLTLNSFLFMLMSYILQNHLQVLFLRILVMRDR